MTDPRALNCEAAANVIALVNAKHHSYDDAAADLIGSLDETELALTLIAAIDALTCCYTADAHDMAMPFEDYIRHRGERIARRRTA